MTIPTGRVSGGVYASPATCARLMGWVSTLAWECRRDGSTLPPDLAVWAEAVIAEGTAHRQAVRSAGCAVAISQVATRADPSSSPVMTVSEVAERWGCSTANVTALARNRRVPGRKTAGRWLFDPADIADLDDKYAEAE